ncbi:DUF350 domain-containing protein [Umezawaea beigongshangensis]|uniref:DUF350 domain-containing protein n=1 Tax=Umezawaea beigongshangensis TaxID=2780383 RepID=UPI0018F23BC4|nr:DUF350 domain-containing protein [Umezawaea beigongshangensis]
MNITTIALEPGFGAAIGRGVGAIALYAVVGLLLMVVGFYAIDWTTPGKLSVLVRTGAPNAVIVTAAGLFSMALIVVVAIYSSAGRLDEGLLSALIFGFVGIVVQVLAVRLLEWVTRLDIGPLIESEKFAPASVVVAAAHIALGLVVAVAIS